MLEIKANYKRKQYLLRFLDQQKRFTPFLVSIDRILGYEANMILKHLTISLTWKWEFPPSQAHKYVNIHMNAYIARAIDRCLHVSRITSYMAVHLHSPFKFVARINLHKKISDWKYQLWFESLNSTNSHHIQNNWIWKSTLSFSASNLFRSLYTINLKIKSVLKKMECNK